MTHNNDISGRDIISTHCLWHVCVLHSSVCERGLSMCRSFLASSSRRIMKDFVVLFLSLSYLLLKDSVSVWAAIHTDFCRKVFAVDWIAKVSWEMKNLQSLKNIHTFSPTGDLKYWEKNYYFILFYFSFKHSHCYCMDILLFFRLLSWDKSKYNIPLPCLKTQFKEHGLLKFLNLVLIFIICSRDKENVRKKRVTFIFPWRQRNIRNWRKESELFTYFDDSPI